MLEYLLLPANNTAWGLIEFGSVFALFVLAGAVVGARQLRLWPAALAGIWTSLIGSLIWLIVVLTVYYAFRGTAAQAAVLRAEGDLDDFQRSGLMDFNVFTMQDFLGGGFYHLLLSPAIAALLATIGGLPGVLIGRWRTRSSAKPTP